MHYKNRRQPSSNTLTEPSRGDDFCPLCGAQVKWIRLISGRWIAVEPEPVLYVDGGRQWLVDDKRYEADIRKRCKVWKPGIVSHGIRKGYRPHVWECTK